MNFITPSFFLLTIFLIGVILFYLFRKQYESKVIPSTLLWQQVMQEWQATKWWKKLQNHLLLYLQLFILLLLMFALTRPFLGLNELSGEHIVVVLDTSATMTVIEKENKNRLTLAKEELEKLLEKLDGQMLTVVLAEEIPFILFSNETSKHNMEGKIKDVEPSYQHSDLNKAIQLANQLLSGTTGEIHVFSDSLQKGQLNTDFLHKKLVVHNVGHSTNNLSLHTFGVAQQSGVINGIVTVFNEFSDEQLVRIDIESEGELLYSIQELIEPGKLVPFSISELPVKPYYKAIITNEDDYKVDDSLFAFLGQASEPAIHLVGNVNPFTRKALGYFSTDIVQYENSSGSFGENVIYVLEGIPDNGWPNGPTLIFSPVEGGPYEIKEKQELTSPVQAKIGDVLFQYVNMDEVYIQSSHPYEAPDLETILASDGKPIISKGYYNGNPIILVGLDIVDTDWPLHSSFPIFLYNAVNYLNETQETLGYFKPLEDLNYAHSAGATKSIIVDEKAEEVMSLNIEESIFKVPSYPGLYKVIEENSDREIEKLFSVTIDSEEKYIKPSSSFSIEPFEGATNTNQEKPNEVWPWLVFFALIVLFVEWEVYRRGISN